MISSSRFTDSNISNIFEQAVTGLAELDGEVAGLAEVSQVLKQMFTRMTGEIDQLTGAFARAFSEREAQRAVDKFAAASEAAEKNTGKPLRIPAGFTAGIKAYIAERPFKALKCIDKLCGQLAKQGDAALLFDDGQRARLKKLLVDAMGAEKAEAALPKIVEELEAAFYSEALNNGLGGDVALAGRPETLVMAITRYSWAHPVREG